MDAELRTQYSNQSVSESVFGGWVCLVCSLTYCIIRSYTHARMDGRLYCFFPQKIELEIESGFRFVYGVSGIDWNGWDGKWGGEGE